MSRFSAVNVGEESLSANRTLVLRMERWLKAGTCSEATKKVENHCSTLFQLVLIPGGSEMGKLQIHDLPMNPAFGTSHTVSGTSSVCDLELRRRGCF